ncbi:DoxX family membrane protein [Prolixibacter sp. NT017]|uniref:DoxX family membrane protein n=1 Tax=Prolixibacter sp. NT017 TaxID=2652390 RepID=UPI0012993F6D|nr:DoxX family membrane protein [Prolixibacter sp. NT017]
MEILFLVARVVVGIYFLENASHHFFQFNMVSNFAKSRGVPMAGTAVIAGGVLLLLGGSSILTGFEPDFGVVSLIMFLLPVTLTVHTFWRFKDPMTRMTERINFTKNLALAGCLTMLLFVPQPWPMSI